MVSFPPGLGHGKMGKLLMYSNILEHLRQIKTFTLPGHGQNKRKMVKSAASSESKDSKGNEESPHRTSYSVSDIKLIEPYTVDYESAKVPCLKKTHIFLLRNEGYKGFFTKSIIPLIDRQFMGTLDPLIVAEMLQFNIAKVCSSYFNTWSNF